MVFNVTPMENIPSPFSQGSWENFVESFPALDPLPFLGLSSYWESSIVTLRWRHFRFYSQHEFPNALDFNNRKLWSLVLTILCFLFFVVVFTKGPTRYLILIFIAKSHSALLDRPGSGSTSLVDFQVSPSVYVPTDADCKITFMEYSFGNSYGAPFVGTYAPPACEFNRVVLNLTVTSAGRQFDRLAIMYLNDTEIWRTSTAEPTTNGIIWTYVKDASNYLPLWKKPQNIIFDLGNLINSIYTGPYNTTLTATFFTEPNSVRAADVILPISAEQSSAGLGSAWQVPHQNATSTLSIPRNVERAVFTVSACGQIDEEFWWSNVMSSDTQTFPDNTLLGYSPFREVQMLIDGELAGVAWPFAIIFTGGVVPGFWRPIVGIDTFDLRENEIDITPWLPVLSDGRDHTYEIRVMGITDDGKGHGTLATVGSYWVVSGKLFLWLDENGTVTTGSALSKNVSDPTFFLTSNVDTANDGTNLTLDYQVLVKRQLSFTSIVTTSNGSQHATWTQTLSFSNTGNLSNDGNTGVNNQMTTGVDVSSSGYLREFSYPLSVWSTYSVSGNNINISANMDCGKSFQAFGPSAFPNGVESFTSNNTFTGASFHTRQNGSAQYISHGDTSQSWGSTEQDLTLSGVQTGSALYPSFTTMQSIHLLYSRHVLAVNANVIQDSNPLPTWNSPEAEQLPFMGAIGESDLQGFAPPSQINGVAGRHFRLRRQGAYE